MLATNCRRLIAGSAFCRELARELRARIEGEIAVGLRVARRPDRAEIEQAAIHEVRWNDVGERIADRLDAPRVLLLPIAQHFGNLPALQMLLRAAQVARNDRKALRDRVAREIA